MHLVFSRLSLLLLISASSWLTQSLLEKYWRFSLSLGVGHSYQDSLFILPLLLTPITFAQYFLDQNKFKQTIVNVLFLSIFFYLSPAVYISGLLVCFFLSFYFLERLLPKSSFFDWIILIITFASAFLPIYIYSTGSVRLKPIEFYFIVLFKSCFAMRFISWAITRRIYHSKEHQGFSAYLEFLFCPIFFIYPGHIQFFIFNYFHNNKSSKFENISVLKILTLALWGIFLMGAFSYTDYIFWKNISLLNPLLKNYYWATQLLIGFYWVIVIYFLQTAGMSYQIALARILGYNFKYDMHWPLLARSPLNFLRTHSSYIKDYVVEMGLKPLSIYFMRKGISPRKTAFISALMSYVLFISMQTGFRPDYNRPWSMTLILIGFFVIALGIEALGFKPKQGKNILSWKMTDYFFWLLTLLLLSADKAAFGIVKYIMLK